MKDSRLRLAIKRYIEMRREQQLQPEYTRELIALRTMIVGFGAASVSLIVKLKYTQNDCTAIRREAAALLGEIGDIAAVSPLMRMLANEQWEPEWTGDGGAFDAVARALAANAFAQGSLIRAWNKAGGIDIKRKLAFVFERIQGKFDLDIVLPRILLEDNQIIGESALSTTRQQVLRDSAGGLNEAHS